MGFLLGRRLGYHGRDGFPSWKEIRLSRERWIFPSWEEMMKSRERWISFLEGDKAITGEMNFFLMRRYDNHSIGGYLSWEEVRKYFKR